MLVRVLVQVWDHKRLAWKAESKAAILAAAKAAKLQKKKKNQQQHA